MLLCNVSQPFSCCIIEDDIYSVYWHKQNEATGSLGTQPLGPPEILSFSGNTTWKALQNLDPLAVAWGREASASAKSWL